MNVNEARELTKYNLENKNKLVIYEVIKRIQDSINLGITQASYPFGQELTTETVNEVSRYFKLQHYHVELKYLELTHEVKRILIVNWE